MADLKPGAFRVWDEKHKFYDEGDGRTQYFLYGDGRLFINEIYGADEPNPLMRFDEADASRYTVERWTGLVDRDGNPVYEGDILKREIYKIANYRREYVGFDIFSVAFINGSFCWFDCLLTTGKYGTIDDGHFPLGGNFHGSALNVSNIIGTIHDDPADLKRADGVVNA